MIFDFSSIKIETAFDWSLILAILGALSFYFGKLISDVKPSEENKYMNYLNGFTFLILFGLFPITALITFNDYLPKIHWLIAIAAQYIIFYYFNLKLKALNIERAGQRKLVLKQAIEKSKELSNKFKSIKKYADINHIKGVINSLSYAKVSSKKLFALTIINYFLTTQVFESNTTALLVLFSGILCLMSTSITAFLYGWSSINAWPEIWISFNGKKKKYMLIKIQENYIVVEKNKKILMINKDKIDFLEFDVFKKVKK